MKLVRSAAMVLVGGALAVGAAPAYAAPKVEVEREVTPRACIEEFSTYAQRDITECREGWSVTRTQKVRSLRYVDTRSQETLTISAPADGTLPAYFWSDVNDVWRDEVFKGSRLLLSKETKRVTYTIRGVDCVIVTKTTIAGGVTTVDPMSNTCPPPGGGA